MPIDQLSTWRAPLSGPSSSGASPASTSRTRSSPAGSSGGASPSGSRSARGRGRGRGCCGGEDDVDDGAHVRSSPDQQAGPSDSARAASKTPSRIYYWLDDCRAIVNDQDGRCTHRYLLELVTVHIRNVYDPATYRDGVIEAMISAFHARFPMHPDHAVHGVWLRRQFHLHIANRRSSFTKAVRAVLQQQAVGLPPRTDGGRPRSCHDIEWRAALDRASGERSARHVAARATQMASGSRIRWGRGGAHAFRAEFVSTRFLKFIIIIFWLKELVITLQL
jgi:hypothetical protein